MQNFDLENVDCHVALGMIEKRWGFPRRTLRALLGMTKSGQSGRSMIEMLGVLAIIGVLSVWRHRWIFQSNAKIQNQQND